MKKSSKTEPTPVNPVENSEKIVDKPVENPVDNSVENSAATAAAATTTTTATATNPTNSASNTPNITELPPEPDAAQKAAEYLQDLQRTRADFENFRKQTELQKSQAMSAARYATVEKFLPLVDDFSRAISTYPDELAPLAKNLSKLLTSLNLEIINSAPGTDFNPDYHEAISVEDGEGDREVVTETLRPGYLYEGSVLRPAMVKVGHQA